MKKIFYFFSFFIALQSFGQNARTAMFNNQTCVYELSNGVLNGTYKSHYSNGQKKAEGTFKNNCRSGEWTVWDSLGNVRMKRFYSDPFHFQQVFPPVPEQKSIEFLNDPIYPLKYNADGYIDYYKLNERSIAFSKRIWRFIGVENNDLIFHNNRLFNLISSGIFKNEITPYSNENDEFKNPLKESKIPERMQIIGYQVKEDFVVDVDRLVSEYRMVGIAPVGIDLDKGDTMLLYWIYYPQLRKMLAHSLLDTKDISQNIKSLDDLFFFRCFSSTIIKESNVYDRSIKDYCPKEGYKKESDRIEVSMIEEEHNFWLLISQ